MLRPKPGAAPLPACGGEYPGDDRSWHLTASAAGGSMVHTTPVGCLIGTCIAAADRCSSSSPATRGAIVGWVAELEP